MGSDNPYRSTAWLFWLGDQACGGSWHQGPPARLAGRMVVGSVRPQYMIWFLRFSDASIVWALETARIWLGIFGYMAAAWAVGFGMGYRRGVHDAMTDNILKADHRVGGD